MLAILKTLPFHRVVMLFLCLLCFIYLTTTIDSCAYVLASTPPGSWRQMSSLHAGTVFSGAGCSACFPSD